jgi:hypothetical protein
MKTASAKLVVFVSMVSIASGAAGAQATRIVRGVVTDSASRQPLAGALVEVRSAAVRATDRTDEEGNFRIRGIPAGQYQVAVLRIGYAEVRREIEVAGRDVEIRLSMRAIAQRLDAFHVRGDITAIYGMVGTLPDLLPVAGARVQVLGADKEHVTDSTGGFFIPLKDPGTYIVRMTREGYAERMFPIEVPRNRAADASRMLDPGEAPAKGLDGYYKDLDTRLRTRAASNSAVVTGAEIRRQGRNVPDGLRSSAVFNARGLRLADSACVFVNGIPRPGVSLESIFPEEVEAVELYAHSGGAPMPIGVPTGDRSNSLALSWPPGASCGQMFRRDGAQGTSKRPEPLSRAEVGDTRTGKAIYVVVWLRK